MNKIVAAILCCFALCACDAQKEQEQEQEQQEHGKYFQTDSSGVVHNSECFWYGKSDGKYVDTPSYGRNCKKCGGRNKK